MLAHAAWMLMVLCLCKKIGQLRFKHFITALQVTPSTNPPLLAEMIVVDEFICNIQMAIQVFMKIKDYAHLLCRFIKRIIPTCIVID